MKQKSHKVETSIFGHKIKFKKYYIKINIYRYLLKQTWHVKKENTNKDIINVK